MREGRGQPQSGPSPLESVVGGGPPASPTLLLHPAPRALADLAGAGALHSEARGGAGPPHTAALRHESPSPTWDPGAGARGPFLVSGWTRSHSAPRRPPKPPVPSTPVPSLVPPSLVWREGLLLSPLCVLVFPAHCRLSVCLYLSSFFCPMVVSSSDRR